MRKKSGAVDAHVGQRIRLRRTLLGISQSKLGAAVGLTFQQIQKYERGVNQLAASRVFQFARVLNVPVTFFFEDMPGEAGGRARSLAEPTQVAFRHEDVTRRETLELVRAYYAIDDPELRKKLRDLVEKIGAAGPDGPSDPNNPGAPGDQDSGAA